MEHSRNQAIKWDETISIQPETNVVGQLVAITPEGGAVVDYPNSPTGPIPARSAIAEPPRMKPSAYLGAKVLLAFEDNNPLSAVIVGFVHDSLFPADRDREGTCSTQDPKELVINGETMLFDAKEEIVLRCGKSSIIMKKNGKVIVRGIEITNRASRTNKIKGGAVKIN